LIGICESSYKAESCPVVLSAPFAMSADMIFSSPSFVKAEVFVHYNQAGKVFFVSNVLDDLLIVTSQPTTLKTTVFLGERKQTLRT
jgi:hypothetical protein